MGFDSPNDNEAGYNVSMIAKFVCLFVCLFNKFQVYPLQRTTLYNRTKSRIDSVCRNIHYGRNFYMAACDTQNKLRTPVIKMQMVCYDSFPLCHLHFILHFIYSSQLSGIDLRVNFRGGGNTHTCIH